MLAHAMICGEKDDLLKENIIIGHFIPAGSGIYRYHDIEIEPPEGFEPPQPPPELNIGAVPVPEEAEVEWFFTPDCVEMMPDLTLLPPIMTCASLLPPWRRGHDHMSMAAPIYYTADMVRALPDDGNRYEVVHGELLVTPSPRLWHEEIVGRLYRALQEYLLQEPVGHAFGSHSDISWGRSIRVEPDVFVVPIEQARSLDWSRMRDLLLVVEVLSPSSSRGDRFTKRRLYQEHGIPVYWIVDGDERLVEVWTPDIELPSIERERVSWHPPGVVRPFVLDLRVLFRPI